jgi:hypothetical protein
MIGRLTHDDVMRRHRVLIRVRNFKFSVLSPNQDTLSFQLMSFTFDRSTAERNLFCSCQPIAPSTASAGSPVSDTLGVNNEGPKTYKQRTIAQQHDLASFSHSS